MTVWLPAFLAGLVIPAAVGLQYQRLDRWLARRGSVVLYESWMVSGIGAGAWMLIQYQWPEAAGNVLSAAIAAVLWWLSRRRRKRAPRAYGAKSKARIQALVRRARESYQPRKVLRPLPEGAGA